MGIKLALAIMFSAILCCGCAIFDSPDVLLTEWTVTGSASVSDPEVLPTDEVRLAAYFSTYRNEGKRPDGPLVTNTVDVSGGGAFSLSFDTRGITPSRHDEIIPLFWIDANKNAVFDTDEKWTWVNPTGEDQVFGPLEPARFGYQGSLQGWRISWNPITNADMSGAAITNALAFSVNPDPWI